jgi:hypothetical protein
MTAAHDRNEQVRKAIENTHTQNDNVLNAKATKASENQHILLLVSFF